MKSFMLLLNEMKFIAHIIMLSIVCINDCKILTFLFFVCFSIEVSNQEDFDQTFPTTRETTTTFM